MIRAPAPIVFALAFAATGLALADGPPGFALPIACTPGIDCFVQNYVDQDPGPEAADYTCGSLSYDGHDGTDIRLGDLTAMAAGVAVLAAAEGIVLRVRDGEADGVFIASGAAAVADREAGNGVVLDHGGGWETQYSHLRQGSVVVQPGQRVAAGDLLGLVGLSGRTEFPHVEFTVRQDGGVVDPFEGLAAGSDCAATGPGLWLAETARRLSYQAGGLLKAGFAAEKPTPDAARTGVYAAITPTTAADALVFWVDVFGTRTGDREAIRLIAPDGQIVAEAELVHDHDRAQWFRFVGLRRPDAGWPPGVYRGGYTLLRPSAGGGSAVIVDVEDTVAVVAPVQ
ncbi:MAG: M23 family metallopeptidase [Alphaproteobacteria bacterium]